MRASEIRNSFLDFFKKKNHKILDSAPMVVKDDPTLMFTNAGMNQFKDLFLGHSSSAKNKRIANTQKCLRVSGKHNDLEEVGKDTYHHTMFEMLGNWSFGDYYKREAIQWAWELLVDVYKISPDRLYVTVFGGDKNDNIPPDNEAYEYWESLLEKGKILKCTNKDNFWEMGDIGPCGPCSEIHIDLRDEKERTKKDGKDLVNQNHPHVLELWNLVFIEYNRQGDGSLEPLKTKHIDTGMGFERLCMVLQDKKSNYDTDVFDYLIKDVEKITGMKYGKNEEQNIAIRVLVDHIRAVSFSITDGQLPSNVKAGYVVRRILRRAVRYYFTFLGVKKPMMHQLVSILAEQYKDIFPEIEKQKETISKVIYEEESAFLKTLEVGLRKLKNLKDKKEITGETAFELYDTYGFPLDLTQLIASENGQIVDEKGFYSEMQKQKDRSRKASKSEAEEWNILINSDTVQFVGYDELETPAKILKYRKVKQGKKQFYQLVLSSTPFYAESGGQVGDKGYISANGEKIKVFNTRKENNLTLHYVEKIPKDISVEFQAIVDADQRSLTVYNHSATHLMHAALKQVLGNHIQQKGSLVDHDHLRFDFSHFEKVKDDELKQIESIVNQKIRKNIQLDEKREVPYKEALKKGATALFGEKYGDKVRVITFDPEFSVELCGGTHVQATGQIGIFKITSESAIAAGVRRIEAITSVRAQEYIDNKLLELEQIKELLNETKKALPKLQALIDENNQFKKEIEGFQKEHSKQLAKGLISNCETKDDVNYIFEIVDLNSVDMLKNVAFELKKQADNVVGVLGGKIDNKANVAVIISDNLVKEKGLNANDIIKEISSDIKGGGGGQAFFAMAGGKNPSGISKAIEKAKKLLLK